MNDTRNETQYNKIANKMTFKYDSWGLHADSIIKILIKWRSSMIREVYTQI